MSSKWALLGGIARGIAKRVLDAASFGVLGDMVFGVAEEAWTDWREQVREEELRRYVTEMGSELAALRAQVAGLAENSDEQRAEVARLAEVHAAGRGAEYKAAFQQVLLQVPGAVRRTLRSQADPTGRTVPPSLLIRGPADLLPLLPSRVSRLRPGMMLRDGSRELVEMLGAGGFGEVWKARNPDRPSAPAVAVKFCTDPEAARTLRNEAGLLDRIAGTGGDMPAGIVRLLDVSLRSDPPFVEYEFVEGADLGAVIRERFARGPGDPVWAAETMKRVLGAVAYAHRLEPPVVHRDLKPANILVDRAGRVRVADFGIGGVAVRQAALQRTQRSGSSTAAAARQAEFLGAHTANYASPQQIRGDLPDPRDDVYSLGVIWHQLLTGRLDEGAPTGLDWADDLAKLGVPADHIRLLGACIAAKSDRRPADAGEMLERMDTENWREVAAARAAKAEAEAKARAEAEAAERRRQAEVAARNAAEAKARAEAEAAERRRAAEEAALHRAREQEEHRRRREEAEFRAAAEARHRAELEARFRHEIAAATVEHQTAAAEEARLREELASVVSTRRSNRARQVTSSVGSLLGMIFGMVGMSKGDVCPGFAIMMGSLWPAIFAWRFKWAADAAGQAAELGEQAVARAAAATRTAQVKLAALQGQATASMQPAPGTTSVSAPAPGTGAAPTGSRIVRGLLWFVGMWVAIAAVGALLMRG